ncbi:energy-coupling factor transporter transmembrane protein EcfT [Candidatus Bathyarchaeota archaeon]|nr:energy-coupling factor transporter transmembrane protein EcfT [Candidatus Bathyarchaeota archaeon]RJS86505.1 MAG: energy-coupling factor transporter transmembrane protein EcfT [Candidatus Bathyarchaeota archaeon]
MSMFDGFKFRSVSSPVHQMDPRAKFIYVCILFVVTVMFSNLIPLIILFLIQVPFVFMARVQKEWMRSMKGSAMFAVIIFVMNLLSLYFYTGYETFGSILERSLAMTVRFIVLVQTFSIFFLTTSPDMLGLALEQSHIPYEICFAFTTAVRFVPVLAEEAQTIMDAQKARGLEMEGGNFFKRIRNYIPILIPLIVNAIRRSLELAETMESRAWGANRNRTNLYVLKMRREDVLLILISLVILAVSIYVSMNVQMPSIIQLLTS